jgi:uncharacterized protein (DUF433 family)
MKVNIIHSDPKILGGTPVFRGTRVPIQTLFDYLYYHNVDIFLNCHPSITREMIAEVLDIVAKLVIGKSKNPIDNLNSNEYIELLKKHLPPEQILFI